jgi:hypothetical protein
MLQPEEEYQNLYLNLIENFAFFIPNKILDNKDVCDFINSLGITLNEEFFEKYLDKMLYVDSTGEVYNLKSTQLIVDFNVDKNINLHQNCFHLAHLKDTIGNATFIYIFNKYVESVIGLNFCCDLLIELYYDCYTEGLDPTFLFRQQKFILQTHLNDIEKINENPALLINKHKITNNLLKCFTSLPGVANDIEKAENTDIKSSTDIKIITLFRDFIIHPKNVDIEKLVKENLSHLKGVNLRYLIEYFIKQNIIIITDKIELHKSFTVLFEGKNISVPNSIFGKKVFNEENANYWNAVKVFNELFAGILTAIPIREFRT